MTPPAPLAAAIEEARDSVAAYRSVVPFGPLRMEAAINSLLLALDSDDRLAKAEAALREIADNRCDCESATDGHANDCPRRASVKTRIARRYFAEKGDDRG